MLDNGLKVRVKKRVRDVSDDTDKPDSKIVKNNEIRPLPSNVIPRASQTAGLGIAAAAPPLMNNDQAASSAPSPLATAAHDVEAPSDADSVGKLTPNVAAAKLVAGLKITLPAQQKMAAPGTVSAESYAEQMSANPNDTVMKHLAKLAAKAENELATEVHGM